MLIIESLRFFLYTSLIVIISKFVLVRHLRNIAENMNLKPYTVGKIAGYATSVPELLTIITASLTGLVEVSIYNILSSNIINLALFAGTILINRNTKILKNKALKIDILLVLLTIIIPIVLLINNIGFEKYLVPIFISLYVIFRVISSKNHKVFLDGKENKNKRKRKIKIKDAGKNLVYIFLIALSGILLYIIGNLLGDSLTTLCNVFEVPEVVIGILLGIITSIPEFITFFESQKHHSKKEDKLSGVIEATNNLFSSNTINLFLIQALGILLIVI